MAFNAAEQCYSNQVETTRDAFAESATSKIYFTLIKQAKWVCFINFQSFEYWWLIYHDFVPQQRKGQVSKSCPLNTVTKRSIQYYMCTYYVSASLYVLLVHLSSLHFRYDRPRTSKYLDGKTRGQKNSKKSYLILLRCSLFF